MLSQACASIRRRLVFSLQRNSKQNTMKIKDLLQDDALKALEDQIIMSFEGCWSKDHDYTDERSLMTKDLHLIDAFHNLFDHTDFAITDFIYCREFYYEIKFEFRNEAQQNH